MSDRAFHDVMASLAALRGSLDLLAADNADRTETERAELLAIALRSTDRLAAQVSALVPGREPAPPAPRGGTGSGRPARTGRVLVVDDDELVRVVVTKALRRRGFTVKTASDGGAALSILAEGGVDAVVLDLMMPTVDGYRVLERLRDHDEPQAIPIVVLSAKAT